MNIFEANILKKNNEDLFDHSNWPFVWLCRLTCSFIDSIIVFMVLNFCCICCKNSVISMWMNVSAAYDPLDPNGNITIKWDVMSWTPDGYVVSLLS